MTIRQLTRLVVLVAVALSAFGCGGDGRPTGNAVRLDVVATTLPPAAGADAGVGAAAATRLARVLAYPVDHLIGRVAIPPTFPDTLGGEAIVDMLRNGINGAAGDPVTEDAAAAVPRAAGEATRAAAADDFAFSYHLAHGYEAWVEVAFFPPEAVTSVSGRGATATWRGRLVAQDLEAGAESAGTLLTGNASITARLEPTAPDARTATGTDHLSLVDVALTDLTRTNGEAARLHELTWSNLDLMAAASNGAALTFHKNSEISGLFYDDGGGVMGRFDKEAIAGVFRAAQHEGIADARITGR